MWGRALTDGGACWFAGAVAVGAWVHRPVPGGLAVALALFAGAWAARRPSVLVLAGACLASVLGSRSMAGMAPATPEPYAGPVTLLADPKPLPYGSRVDVRVGSRHLEMVATGSARGTVQTAAAGERLLVSGRIQAPPPHAPWLVPRHVVGRLVVARVDVLDRGSPPWAAANRVRRVLIAGADAIPMPARSLYTGFVLGDDRGQPPEVVDDFLGSGLTHVLVVSGENVAFVLVLVSPLTSRLRLGARWAVTVGVIALFGTVTRFEPSVLRASAMAALAVSASFAGRPASTIRLLALASAALVLVDPLLVRAVGFQLSVAASAGIALLAGRLAARIPGPRRVAEAIGVTLAAQLGVAPVLVPRFGGLPVVSLAANLLAVPVAGLVTTWGLPAGLVAGAVGGPVAVAVHLPTRVFIWWVATVARVTAALPLGELGLGHVAALVVLTVLVLLVRRRVALARTIRGVLCCLIAAVSLGPAIALRSPPPRTQVPGGVLYRAGPASVLVLDRRLDAQRLLEGLRRTGTRRLDLVVRAGGLPPDVARALGHRWSVGPTLDPASGPARAVVGPLAVAIDAQGRVAVQPDNPDPTRR